MLTVDDGNETSGKRSVPRRERPTTPRTMSATVTMTVKTGRLMAMARSSSRPPTSTRSISLPPARRRAARGRAPRSVRGFGARSPRRHRRRLCGGRDDRLLAVDDGDEPSREPGRRASPARGARSFPRAGSSRARSRCRAAGPWARSACRSRLARAASPASSDWTSVMSFPSRSRSWYCTVTRRARFSHERRVASPSDALSRKRDRSSTLEKRRPRVHDAARGGLAPSSTTPSKGATIERFPCPARRHVAFSFAAIQLASSARRSCSRACDTCASPSSRSSASASVRSQVVLGDRGSPRPARACASPRHLRRRADALSTAST